MIRPARLPRRRCPAWLGLFAIAWLGFLPAVFGASLAEAETKFQTGKFEAALEAATEGLDKLPNDEDWHHLRLRCLLTLGRYPEARAAATNAVARNGCDDLPAFQNSTLPSWQPLASRWPAF